MRATVLVVLIALVIAQAQRFGFQHQQQQQQQPRQQSQYKFQQSSFSSQPSSFATHQSSPYSSRNTPQVPQQQPKSSVSCPEKNGRFPTRTCDGYIECEDGVGEEKLCPDGLLFNPAAGIFHFPCQYPIDVDCTGREQTQPAQPTEDCPHQYGYYRMGDAANCGQFKNCVEGRGYIFDCPEGLAFSDDTYRCDWPDQVVTCDSEAYLGFTCPPGPDARGVGEEDYKSFRSPRDCQRYFICVSAKPRLYNCGEGQAFNELINTCDGVENVTGCASSQFDRKAPSSQFKVPSSQFNRQPSYDRQSQYNSGKKFF